MENLNKEQLVSLKVMRLLKPSLYSALPCFTESEHFSDNFSKLLLDQTFNISQQEELNSPVNCSLTDFLVIPQIFGNLYIGETFTSYICLHNHSVFKVKNLNVKVELQTLSQKIALPFKSNIDSVEDFESDQKFDGIVEHDVKELGNHILICIVSYATERQEKMSFKKFYKFIVSKPFEIQPRFPYLEHKNNLNTVLFEAQIQNITNSLLFMEKVQLQSLNENVIVEDLHRHILANKPSITSTNTATISTMPIDSSSNFKYNKFAIIKPSEVKQYLFKVNFKNIDSENKPLTVGKLDITWRNLMGELGHLQTHPLSQTQEICNLNQKEIQIIVKEIPEKCFIDEELSFVCQINNNSDREIDLALRLENDRQNGYIWNCRLTHQIGKIASKNSASIRLNIIPYKSGFLSISGISITDLLLKRLHEFTQVTNIFVNVKDQLNETIEASLLKMESLKV